VVDCEPGRLPDFVEPMKAKLINGIQPDNWIYEMKFDGYRASRTKLASAAILD
jgi:ATP-dependent DNA ligase